MGNCVLPFTASSEARVPFNRTTGMPAGIDPGNGYISAAFYTAGSHSTPVIEYRQSRSGFAKLCDEVARFHPDKTVIKAAGGRHMLAYDALRLRGASIAICSPFPHRGKGHRQAIFLPGG